MQPTTRLARVETIQNALCYYCPDLLARESESTYQRLVESLPWARGRVRVRGKVWPERRLTCLFSSYEGKTYHYSGKKMVGVAWHPLVREIRRQVTEICRRDYPEWQQVWSARGEDAFDTALCNYYRPKEEIEAESARVAELNGTEVEPWKPDVIHFHSDSEADLVVDAPIASVSFSSAGGVRRFDLRCNAESRGVRTEAPIQHDDVQTFLLSGSLFVMGRDTQRYYTHQVPEQRKVHGGRVNITFRMTKRHYGTVE
jgi:alkylated DNA repair dioxygenase AlkB